MAQKTPTRQERLKQLEKERDRIGKKPLSTDQRIQKLNEIYDGLLFMWQECVISGSSKSTGAISFQLERARQELEALGQRTDTAKEIKIRFLDAPTEEQAEA